MNLVIFLGLLAAAQSASSITTSSSSTTTTEKPFKPSRLLSTTVESRDKIDMNPEPPQDSEENKNKRALNKQIGYGFNDVSSKSTNARSYQHIKQFPPYRFIMPSKQGQSEIQQRHELFQNQNQNHDVHYTIYVPDKSSENQGGVDQQYNSDNAEESNSFTPSKTQEEQQFLQQQKEKLAGEPTSQTSDFTTQFANYVARHQNVPPTTSPSYLAKAIANSPYFSGGVPVAFGGGFGHSHGALFAPHQTMYQAVAPHPGFGHGAPYFYHPNPLPHPMLHGHGVFAHAPTPFGHAASHFSHGATQFVPIFILGVGGQPGMGGSFISHQSQFSHPQISLQSLLYSLLRQQHTPQIFPGLSHQQQPHLYHRDDSVLNKVAYPNTFPGLPTKPTLTDFAARKSALSPTSPTKIVKTEPVVEPRQHIQQPTSYQQQLKYENYMEKA